MLKKRILIILLTIATTQAASAQTNLTISSLQDLLTYADSHSSTIQNNSQQALLTRYQTIAAKLGMLNLKGDAILSSVKNTNLPVSFLPAEIFGGPAGTYRQVTLGQRYTSAATIAPQIDILNPYAAAKIKIAKADERRTELNNLISKKELYQSIAAAYYNILSYQWQIEITVKTLQNADSIASIFTSKLAEGLLRQQDVNSAIINTLTVQDKLQQLKTEQQQQYNTLKILCDIDAGTTIQITPASNKTSTEDSTLTSTDNLSSRKNMLQYQYQIATLRADKKWFYPTLTAYGSFSWQQYSNETLYGSNRWIPINYIGLRLTIPLLPDANKIAAVRYDRVNLRITETNTRHSILQDSLNNRQAELEYQKAYTSYKLSTQIASLKEDQYRKNINIYNEGILTATELFTSFTDWLNGNLNQQAQKANTEYAKAKILITHSIK